MSAHYYFSESPPNSEQKNPAEFRRTGNYEYLHFLKLAAILVVKISREGAPTRNVIFKPRLLEDKLLVSGRS